ncbi:hypothetical protein BC938DRAFT_475720 [Jimgerdemannia flammicorona]|uniref:Uncharacterized protein n=1 Tax=Jimgerdemannia flammicorona TaxID=994334 RepID=A0A433PPN5_9FUNG|nr:hypothetical protein BC938DRAFT_475720 [Jimgerdemannia flammicorona]
MNSVQLWMQDPEMMCVIALSDVGAKNKDRQIKLDNQEGSSSSSIGVEDVAVQWGSTTLGQCVVLLEFVWAVRELRMKQKNVSRLYGIMLVMLIVMT